MSAPFYRPDVRPIRAAEDIEGETDRELAAIARRQWERRVDYYLGKVILAAFFFATIAATFSVVWVVYRSWWGR